MDEPADEIDPSLLIDQARGGSAQALARLAEHYRPYLALLARLRTKPQLQAKYDDSDLVQETLLRVHHDLPAFQGTTEEEFTAWLRSVMAAVSKNLIRHHTRQRRDASLERKIEEDFTHTSQMLGKVIVASDPSPSERTIKREQAVIRAR